VLQHEVLVENVFDLDEVWLSDELCDFEGVFVGVLPTIHTTNATVRSQRADGQTTGGGCVQLALRGVTLLIEELCRAVATIKEIRRLVWAGAISQVVRY
jgi:hypothetical protein